jgi:hypothetical protein
MTEEELLEAIRLMDKAVSMAEGVGIEYFARDLVEDEELELMRRAFDLAGVQ